MSTGCHKDRKTGRQTDGQTDRQKDRRTNRQTDGQTDRKERNKDFSAQLSKQKLFIMSTGCHKDRKKCRQIDRCQQHVRKIEGQTDRQKDS